MKFYRLKCMLCFRKWSSTNADRKCPFCGTDMIDVVGASKR